jgi:hypothetical protein
MTKILSMAALIIGAFIVAWMGLSFVGTDLAALLVTLVIGIVYLIGFTELLRYQKATIALSDALNAAEENVSSLEQWLSKLPSALQISVRLRIQGEHIGLPAPVLSPYLIGLLVMLGLLGTFIGMVDTLQGAVTALQGSTELEAIREGLAAPIKGLSTAFGTSVAGVATSAMLGLVSTLSRRDRMQASRLLDSKVDTVFQNFSLTYNRQQTYQAMQQQAQALPEVADKLAALVDKLADMSSQISNNLTTNQQQFHSATQSAYTELANSVDQTLKQSLAESGRLAGESIQPVIQQMVENISSELKGSQQQLNNTAQQQTEQLSKQLANTTDQLNQTWQSGFETQQTNNKQLLEQVSNTFSDMSKQLDDNSKNLLTGFSDTSSNWLAQQQDSDKIRTEQWSSSFDQLSDKLRATTEALTKHNETTSTQLLNRISELLQSSEKLVQSRVDTENQWLNSYEQRMEQLTNNVTGQLESLREAEQHRGDAAVARLAELEVVVTQQLSTLGNSLEQPMNELIRTATDTPKAAAELFEKMRHEISQQIERDNAMLEDRTAIMAQLNTLSGSLLQAASSQREAIEGMVSSSADILKQVGSNFSEQVNSETDKLSSVTNLFAASTAEMSSLAETFGVAVESFNKSNNGLIDSLSNIEQALQNSTLRSDEQLAYYIAQAREIIDHSMLSQQEVIDQLHLFKNTDTALAAEAS